VPLKEKKRIKMEKKNFYNQNTIIMKIVDDQFLNIKLFYFLIKREWKLFFFLTIKKKKGEDKMMILIFYEPFKKNLSFFNFFFFLIFELL